MVPEMRLKAVRGPDRAVGFMVAVAPWQRSSASTVRPALAAPSSKGSVAGRLQFIGDILKHTHGVWGRKKDTDINCSKISYVFGESM